MINGQKREINETNFNKRVGIFSAKVIAINPDVEEFKEILGMELKEDSKATEYLGESKEGNTTCRVDVWLQDTIHNDKFKVTFFLEDKNKVNKDETKKQYINNIGNCSWASKEELLPSWFSKRDFRVAKVGEEELYGFLRTWLSLDYSDADTELSLDWKKLMKGNVKELKSQVGESLAVSVVGLAMVKTVVKDDETKEYQSIYNKGFLPEYTLKQFKTINFNDEKVQNALKSKESKDLKPYERFVLQVVGEYGPKDFYTLSPIKDYDEKENLVSTNEAMKAAVDEEDDLPF